MPVRSTLLQRVAFQVHRQLAAAAQVEESSLLPDRMTGQLREVDVVIRSRVGLHEVILSIECRDHARKATVEWVEQMATKHQFLPTSKLILISRIGFTNAAVTKAAALKIDAYSFDEAAANDWTNLLREAIGAGLDLWACRIRQVYLVFADTDGNAHPAGPDTPMLAADCSSRGDLRSLVRSHAQASSRFTEAAIDFAIRTGDRIFGAELTLDPPPFARDDKGDRRRIRTIRLLVEAAKAPEFQLTTATFRRTPIAYGEGQSAAGPFTISFVRTGQGIPTGAISVVDERGAVQTSSLNFHTDDSKLLFLTEPIGMRKDSNTA